MSYPMWNPDRTGIIVSDGVRLRFIESGPEFEALRHTANDFDKDATAPRPPVEIAEARAKRNALLTESDWTQVADAPVDQAAWGVYRQALRDVPQQSGFPTDIAWPTKP